MLLKIFHEYSLIKRDSELTDDEISLGRKINEKACKHFWYISSRIREEVSKMNKFKGIVNSWDFSHASFSMFVDRQFYTSAHINSLPQFDMIYFFFTEELFTIPSAKLIDKRVPIFESIQDKDNHFNTQFLNLKKRWRSIY